MKIHSLTKTFVLLIAAWFFASCSDDDSELAQNYETLHREYSSMRLFTNEGEIDDQDLIMNVASRNDVRVFGFDPESGQKEEQEFDLRVQFNNTQALVSSSHGAEIYNYTLDGSFLRLRSLDTINFLWVDTFIFEYLNLHQPLYRKTEPYNGNGLEANQITMVPEFYFLSQSNQIRFPLLNFYVFGGNTYAGSEDYNNELNEEAFLGLEENDTLVVQQSWIVLE